MPDELHDCAKAFQKLLDVNYHIIAGRKGQKIDIYISFQKDHFHHLAGLHKLRDIEAVAGKRTDVLDSILNGKISNSDISKSMAFENIKKRICLLTHIEQILDDNRIILKYHRDPQNMSHISAKYMLSSSYSNDTIFIFLDNDDDSNFFFCRSFFPMNQLDYRIGQPQYTLLFKEKIFISTGYREIQYDIMTPKAEKEAQR